MLGGRRVREVFTFLKGWGEGNGGRRDSWFAIQVTQRDSLCLDYEVGVGTVGPFDLRFSRCP